MAILIEGFGGLPVSETTATVNMELARRGLGPADNTVRIRTYDRGRYLSLQANNSTYPYSCYFKNLTGRGCKFVAFRCRGNAAFTYMPWSLWGITGYTTAMRITSTNNLIIYATQGLTAATVILPGTYTDWKDLQFVLNSGVLSIYLNANPVAIYSSTFTPTSFNDLVFGSTGGVVGGVQGIEVTNIVCDTRTEVDTNGIEIVNLTATVESNTGTVGGGATDALDAFAVFSDTGKYVRYLPGERTTFTLAPLTTQPFSVSGVSITTLGQSTGSMHQLQRVYATTTGEHEVDTPTLAAGWSGQRSMITQDPYNNAPLDMGIINTLKIGIGG